VIKWRKWTGNEIVMDAGCGSGLLTKQLAKQVPRGKVYAVDTDSNMIKQAKNNLKLLANVEIIQSSFTDVSLPRKMDIILLSKPTHTLYFSKSRHDAEYFIYKFCIWHTLNGK
jgi:tRNA A58 N-methylase Trm61